MMIGQENGLILKQIHLRKLQELVRVITKELRRSHYMFK